MNLIYNKYTGDIDKPLPDSQDYLAYYKLFPQEFKDSLMVIHVDILREDWKDCRVVDGVLVVKSSEELQEIEEYGRVLTEEEREQLNLPKPPTEMEILKEEVKELQSVIDALLEG